MKTYDANTRSIQNHSSKATVVERSHVHPGLLNRREQQGTQRLVDLGEQVVPKSVHAKLVVEPASITKPAVILSVYNCEIKLLGKYLTYLLDKRYEEAVSGSCMMDRRLLVLFLNLILANTRRDWNLPTTFLRRSDGNSL
jgi:hypothetical protein